MRVAPSLSPAVRLCASRLSWRRAKWGLDGKRKRTPPSRSFLSFFLQLAWRCPRRGMGGNAGSGREETRGKARSGKGRMRGGSGRGGRLAVARTSRLRHPSVWGSLAPFESKKSCAWTGVMDHERDGEHHDEQRLQHFQFLKVPLLVHRIEFN